jgi:hypothetical protein
MRPEEGKKRREPRASAVFVFLCPCRIEARRSAPKEGKNMNLDAFKTEDWLHRVRPGPGGGG